MKTIDQVEKELAIAPETRYPKGGFFSGEQEPCRWEGEVYNCIVRGKIPPEIDGTYYRVMPDVPFAPLYEDDVFINGDGCIHAVRIRDGHVDFKSRFVRTDKFCIERAARQSVFGKYRNRYTDDPRVKHAIHSTANTHVVFYEKQLLALKEDSKPYALDPDTLETKGYYDFHGQYTAPTHTAHPKVDASNGEYITMGFEAKGDSTPDLVYYLFDRDGKKLEECWLKTPWAGSMHDMAATDKWIVFYLGPLATVPVELLKDGHKHYAWDNDKPLVFGILPRRNPKPEDARWFTMPGTPGPFLGHMGNAFDGEDGCVYLDAPICYGNRFWFFPPLTGETKQNPKGFTAHYVRWKLDPNAEDRNVKAQVLVDVDGDFPHFDSRFLTKPYSKFFLTGMNKYEDEGDTIYGGVCDSVVIGDVKTGEYKSWSAGRNSTVHEVAFVKRSEDAPECDGWVLTFVNRRDRDRSYVYILDTAKIEDGPVAIIDLSFRLRGGIHGTWVPAESLEERKDLCDMSCISEEVRKEFENKPVKPAVASNGHAV